MWQLTSIEAAIPAVLIGMVSLGIMVVCWKVNERRGCSLGHTMLDFSFAQLVLGCGAGVLFGSVPAQVKIGEWHTPYL